MTYREQLNKLNELGINICDLTIANELDCVLDCDYNEKDFERLCDLAVDLYLKSDSITANSIAHAINDLIANENYSITQVLEMERWDLILKASYYD